LLEEAKRIEANFGEAYDLRDIPRVDVAQALGDYLQVIELNPRNIDAYVGAANCYCIMNSQAEALALDHKARAFGLSTKRLDQILSVWKLAKSEARPTVAKPAK